MPYVALSSWKIWGVGWGGGGLKDKKLLIMCETQHRIKMGLFELLIVGGL